VRVKGVLVDVEYKLLSEDGKPTLFWYSTTTINKILRTDVVQRTDLDRALANKLNIKFWWM